MPLSEEQIRIAFNKFINLRNSVHRYASFDYCYNYFNSYSDKSELALPENLEKSCLHLGFYLASWGMFRNSKLMQKSIHFYIPIIKWLANECPADIWSIDVNNYNEENISLLTITYNTLDDLLANINKNKRTLITKIMLGIFGNCPAFDDYFTETFRKCYGQNTKYRSFNSISLLAIKQFYDDNENLIEELRQGCRTFNFLTREETIILYTRAKIIDMIGFGHQI